MEILRLEYITKNVRIDVRLNKLKNETNNATIKTFEKSFYTRKKINKAIKNNN